MYNTKYNVVAENPQSTVVAQYFNDTFILRDANYQTEAELEKEFINQLYPLKERRDLRYLFYSVNILLLNAFFLLF